MIATLLGKKIGMTQVYDAQNVLVPVTVVEAGPCPVVQIKTVETDGYNAVQLGFGAQKAKNASKAEANHAKKAGLESTPRVLNEVRLTEAFSGKAGDVLTVAVFAEGQVVDVLGVSKGKGFQGVVKRHHFGGGRATHGSMFHRAPGSIGASSYPSRVIKGMRAAGHMGVDRVTTRNLKVVKVDVENHLLVVRGAVPGKPGGVVLVRKAVAAKPEPQPQPEKPGKGGRK